jgi:hypothetical protein
VAANPIPFTQHGLALSDLQNANAKAKTQGQILQWAASYGTGNDVRGEQSRFVEHSARSAAVDQVMPELAPTRSKPPLTREQLSPLAARRRRRAAVPRILRRNMIVLDRPKAAFGQRLLPGGQAATFTARPLDRQSGGATKYLVIPKHSF